MHNMCSSLNLENMEIRTFLFQSSIWRASREKTNMNLLGFWAPPNPMHRFDHSWNTFFLLTWPLQYWGWLLKLSMIYLQPVFLPAFPVHGSFWKLQLNFRSNLSSIHDLNSISYCPSYNNLKPAQFSAADIRPVYYWEILLVTILVFSSSFSTQ